MLYTSHALSIIQLLLTATVGGSNNHLMVSALSDIHMHATYLFLINIGKGNIVDTISHMFGEFFQVLFNSSNTTATLNT